MYYNTGYFTFTTADHLFFLRGMGYSKYLKKYINQQELEKAYDI